MLLKVFYFTVRDTWLTLTISLIEHLILAEMKVCPLACRHRLDLFHRDHERLFLERY